MNNGESVLILRIVASAGATAFALTAFIEAVFGKTTSEVAWYATEISLAAIVSAAALSRLFLRAAVVRKSLSRSLLIASAGLLLIYPVFAIIHSIFTDRAQSISEVVGAVMVVPVFLAFSVPVAWPLRLVAC